MTVSGDGSWPGDTGEVVDECFPPADWLGGIKDLTVSFNVWLTETEFRFFCGGTIVTLVELVSEES